MVLLPSNQKEFADPTYWKKFFDKCDSAFEWYGDYSSLGPILEHYIKASDNVLQIGCGNSLLAEQLYDNGYRNITSIDTEARVIQKQIRRNEKRPELVFKTVSAAETGLEDGTMNIVVDKGTLDALLPVEASADTEKLVNRIFEEVDRVLAPLGRYICVTLAQEHIVHKFMQHFREPSTHLVRVHRVESPKSFSMPLFVFVATKMRSALPKPPPIEMLNAAGRWERFDEDEGLLMNLRGEREFAWLFHQTAGKQCSRHRLLLVRLIRGQEYLSINHIELEITDLARKLAPVAFGLRTIEFLSLGRMESMETVASGESPVNGKWTVEHVKGTEDKVYRRLIFLNSSSLIQSEVEMLPGKGNKLRMNDDYLSCDHHRSMITSLQFLAGDLDSTIRNAAAYRFCVLGLGGGLLAKFLHKKLPGCTVVGVEYDKAVVKVARGQFGLPSDEHIQIIVDDAYKVMEDYAEKEDAEKFDVVFMDLATSESDVDGLACPPSKFATPEAIELARKCLRPGGVFSMNLVTRDDEIVNRVKADAAAVFPNALVINEEEDVNEVLVCPLHLERAALRKGPKPQAERWISAYAQMLTKLQPVLPGAVAEENGNKHAKNKK